MNLFELDTLTKEERTLIIVFQEHIRKLGFIYLDPINIKTLENRFDRKTAFKIAKKFFHPVRLGNEYLSQQLGFDVRNLTEDGQKKLDLMLDKYDLPVRKRRIIPDWFQLETAYFEQGHPPYHPLSSPPVSPPVHHPVTSGYIIPSESVDFYYSDMYKIADMDERLSNAIRAWKGGIVGNFKLALKRLMKPSDYKKCSKMLTNEISTDELGTILLDSSIEIVIPDNFELLINDRVFEVLYYVLNRKRIFEKYSFLVINIKSNNITKSNSSIGRKNSISGITKKKNDKNFKTKETDEDLHPMVAYVRTLKNISKIRDPLTEEQAIKLMQKFDSKLIRQKIDALENMKGCEKKYNSVYLTLNNWCKMEQKRYQNENTGQLQTKYKKIL